MKGTYRNILKASFTAVLFCAASGLLLAQPGDPGGDPDEVPIDGISVLVAVGGLFGAKKVYDMKKR